MPLMNPPRSMTREQVRAFDRQASEEWGVPGIVLMENAGRNAAGVATAMLREPESARVAVLCGAGNNGGDGFVVARHLLRQSVDVQVWMAVDAARIKGDARVNHAIWRCLRGAVKPLVTPQQIEAAKPEWARCALIVDALLGTGFSGEVRKPFGDISHAVNETTGPKVLALDVPSGLDCDTGRAGAATIRANTTVTFVARKTGFDVEGAEAFTGRIVVADIGVPMQI